MTEDQDRAAFEQAVNPRETQFAGFAKLLYDELAHNVLTSSHMSWEDFEQFKQEQYHIIARRAYDLVAHTIENTEHIDLDRLTTQEHVLRIPDLTTFTDDGQ